MHGLQIQDAARYQALQAVRPPHRLRACRRCLRTLSSFELGGEKKTKGAALQFVSSSSSASCVSTRLIVRVVIVFVFPLPPCLAIRILAAITYLPRLM